MNDLERRLRELGEQARGEVKRDLTPRRSALQKIRRRRLAAGTSVFTTLALLVGGGAFALSRAEGEQPPVPPADARRTPDPSACGFPLDFEPTYLPPGFSGEPRPRPEDAPWVVARFDGGKGAVIDLTTPAHGFSQTRPSEIEVLDGPATIGAIHEGYSVAFDRGRCHYVLNAYGVSMRELQRFAEGLRELTPLPFAGMWPEDSRGPAYDACKVRPLDRRWPLTVARDFVRKVVGWRRYELDTSDKGNPRKVNVNGPNPPYEDRVPDVQLFLKEVLPDCWSITSVTTGRLHRATDPGVSVRGRTVEIAFDPHEAAAATVEVGYGGRVATAEWEGGDPVVRLELPFDPDTTGHFLVLLRNPNGFPFGAIGRALPPGDFPPG